MNQPEKFSTTNDIKFIFMPTKFLPTKKKS